MHYLIDRYLTLKSITLFALDAGVITATTSVAVWLRLGIPYAYTLSVSGYLYPIILIIFVHMAALYYHDMYALRGYSLRSARGPLFFAVARSVLVSSGLLFCLYYLIPDLSIGRGIFLINMVLLPVLLTGTRVVYLGLARSDRLRNHVLLLGEPTQVKAVWERMTGIPDHVVVGGIYTGEEIPEGCPPTLGVMTDLRKIVEKHNVDQLIVAMREQRGRLPLQDLLFLKIMGIGIETQAAFLERATGRVPVEGLAPSNLVFSDGFNRINIYQRIKLLIDLLIASACLVITFPLLLLIALVVRLDSRGPVFYRQIRVGRGGQEFVIYKFRTMRVDAEQAGAQFAQTNDPRVTRVGRFLRKSRLDELPQMINVIKGEMAFVGPRPERPQFVADLERQIPYYYLRTVVRPGITGWAQIRYPYGETLEEHQAKLEHDLYYIKNISLTLDTLISIDTIRVVLLSKGGR